VILLGATVNLIPRLEIPMSTVEEQIAQLEAAVVHLEAQRSVLGDTVVETALAPLTERLSDLRRRLVTAPSAPLAGERRMVTVMFADISGFTAMAGAADAEAMRDLMNDCFDWLVPIIEKYEGRVDKFIGDEIMALFGAPIAHENDPERALRAALGMKGAIAAFNAERGTDLELHFGVNTGFVVAGGIGTRGRQRYSVIGDAVNLAARLKDASVRGEILVGPDTFRLTEPLFEFEPLEAIAVKGKTEPVPVYRVQAPRAIPGALRGIAGLESPLVGRQAEFRALLETIERLRAGEGGIVTLAGEAGLGKSRLVAEIREHISRQGSSLESPELRWVEGRCLSYGTSTAYLLWLDVLRGLMGVTMEDTPDTIRDALQDRVESLCPDRYETVYPYLIRLMAMPPEAAVESTAPDLEDESPKSATFQAVESLLEGAAQQCPTVVVCEDLHWADPTSVELLEQLLALTDRAPLQLVCVFRP
jgi:class 3 adenylate cyclase